MTQSPKKINKLSHAAAILFFDKEPDKEQKQSTNLGENNSRNIYAGTDQKNIFK